MQSESTKKCVLLVVDALSDAIVQEAMEDGRWTHIPRLIENGGSCRPCTSIFPSITPAATCSLATGAYPAEHGIEGAYWFDRERGEVAYFGDDLQLLWERGLHKYLADFADRLNYERLQSPTIYQQAAEHGIDSACINFMWFAGTHTHRRSTPLLLRMMAGALPKKVQGPRYMKLGDFVETLPEGVTGPTAGGMRARYGFNDETTGECLLEMARCNALPPLTVGYFPDNDFKSHERGPEWSSQHVLVEFDRWLGRFVEAVGGWSRIGEDLEIVIVGDHGQSRLIQGSPNGILLDEHLSDLRKAVPGEGWGDDDDIFICPNMRAAALYLRDPDDAELRTKVTERLVEIPGVDQVIYNGAHGARNVLTKRAAPLRFHRLDPDLQPDNAATGSQTLRDAYGGLWVYEGSLEGLDLQRGADGTLLEGKYPNPLERIDTSFIHGQLTIFVTAEDGWEFRVRETTTHDTGSHGSLNRDDSQSCLITSAGVSLDQLPNPERPRAVDVAPLCLGILGVSSPEPVMV